VEEGSEAVVSGAFDVRAGLGAGEEGPLAGDELWRFGEGRYVLHDEAIAISVRECTAQGRTVMSDRLGANP
jgi:hypothetical protein